MPPFPLIMVENRNLGYSTWRVRKLKLSYFAMCKCYHCAPVTLFVSLATCVESLAVWSRDGTRGVWLHVCIEHTELIPGCVRLGFIFHHALESYAMLKLWLAEDEPDNLPPFATQYLGKVVLLLLPFLSGKRPLCRTYTELLLTDFVVVQVIIFKAEKLSVRLSNAQITDSPTCRTC